jgi:type I restriction enzyme S subunit
VKVQTVDDVCELVTDGTHYTPPNAGSGVPFLTVKDMSEYGLDFVNCSKISAANFASADAGNSSPKPGDVLFSKDGTVGKVHVVTEPRDFAVLSSIAILRPKRDVCDPQYLGHALKSPSLIEQAARSKTGSAIRRVILSDLRRLNFPLPAIDEQRRIAAILDKADELRTKRRDALAHLDALTQSIFHSMFGSVREPNENIPLVPLDSLCRLVRGSSPRPQGDPRYFGGPVPRLMIADITRDGDWVTPRIDTLTVAGAAKSRPVSSGTVVMAVSGNIGLAAILAVDACIHDGFVGFTELDETRIEARFLQTVLKVGRSLHDSGVAGAIFKNITTTDIKRTKIPLPPLELQQAFAIRVSAVERLKETHRKHLAELDALFTSLQHRAFKGEL